MSDADPLHSHIQKLGSASLSGESSALVVDSAVLSANGNILTEAVQESDVEVGCADGYFDVGGDGTCVVEGLDDFFEGGGGSVALPVSSDEVLSFAVSGCLAGAGARGSFSFGLVWFEIGVG